MKKSRFTEEQIAYALRLADSGTPVTDVCRRNRHLGCHLLYVEEEVRRTWRERVAQAQAARGREHAIEADRGGPHARQTDPAGGRAKKALKAVKRRLSGSCGVSGWPSHLEMIG